MDTVIMKYYPAKHVLIRVSRTPDTSRTYLTSPAILEHNQCLRIVVTDVCNYRVEIRDSSEADVYSGSSGISTGVVERSCLVEVSSFLGLGQQYISFRGSSVRLILLLAVQPIVQTRRLVWQHVSTKLIQSQPKCEHVVFLQKLLENYQFG